MDLPSAAGVGWGLGATTEALLQCLACHRADVVLRTTAVFDSVLTRLNLDLDSRLIHLPLR